MQKLSVFAVMLAVLASCTKQNGDFATARLDYTVSGNSMTKVSTSEVQSAVEQAVRNLPVEIYYGLKNTNPKKCVPGATVSVPVGEVKVRLEYYNGYPQIENDVLFYTEPYFLADTTVVFHSYYNELTVRAHFKCSMVVVDPSETYRVYLGNNELNLADYGTFRAFYVMTEKEGAEAELRIEAESNTDFKNRTMTIKPNELEWGKWYMLSPDGITEGNAEVDFDIDGFEEGGRI